MMEKIEIALPPSGYFVLRDFLITSLVYLSAYSDASLLFESDRKVILIAPSSETLRIGLRRLINKARETQREHYSRISLRNTNDINTLDRIASVLSGKSRFAKSKSAARTRGSDLIDKLFEAYSSYIDRGWKLCLDELKTELKHFDLSKGYNVRDKGYAPISLLKPEFMEFGRGLGVEPDSHPVRSFIRLGVHSMVLGLAGACLSKIYRDPSGKILLFAVFDDRYFEFARQYVGYISAIAVAHRWLIYTMRGREYPSEASRLLHLALRFPKLPVKIISMLESGYRVDALSTVSITIPPYRLLEFITLLYSDEQGVRLARKLDILLSSLRPGSAEYEKFSGRVSRLCEELLIALTLVDQDLSEALSRIYDMWRDVILDTDFVRHLKEHLKIEFTGSDLKVLVSTLEKLYYLVRAA